VADGTSEAAQPAQVAAPAHHPLSRSLLRVRDSENQVVGAAFLAGDGWVCTCAHVVAAALGVEATAPAPPTGEVRLELYHDGAALAGKVECWIADRAAEDDATSGPRDIALLKLREPGTTQPGSGRPARLLAPRQLAGRAFATCGFPGGEGRGVWAHGVFREQRANGTFQVESPGAAGFRLQPGFSGAPVWDERDGAVVGMVVSSWRDPQPRAAFVIPVQALLAATGERLASAAVDHPFAPLTAGLSAQPDRALGAFLRNYLGTAERPAPFGGRQAQLAALDRWLSDDERPYRLVVSPAGRGKSILLAQWASAVAASGRADVILVPISLRFATNQLLDVERLVRDRLEYLLPAAEPLGERSLAALLARERDPQERPLLLVFDALDEATGWHPERELPLPSRPVPGIRALVSARVLVGRDAGGWRAALGWQDTADTMGLGALTQDGIRDVLAALRIETAEDSATDALVAALHDASDGGDPLLVGLFARAIGPGGFVTAKQLPKLTGLSDYFESWWDAQRTGWTSAGRDPRAEAARATLLFGMLASALGPLGLDELSQLTGIASAAVLQEDLTELGRWVIAVGEDRPGQHTYAFAHPRLGDYWREQKMTAREREHADRELLLFCRQQLAWLREGGDPGAASPYALRYYATHLELQRAADEHLDALICPAWWHAHRALSGADETFLRDLWAAWDRAAQIIETSADEDPERAADPFGRLFRYTLIATLLHGLSRVIPSALLTRLVTADPHRWTPQWALEQARRHTDPSGALAALAPHLPADERAQALAEALSTARAIGNGTLRGRASVALAPQLPAAERAHLLGAALRATKTIAEEGGRAQTLVALAPLLPAELLEEALSYVEALREQTWRVTAATALAPRLPAQERARVLRETLRAALTIAGENWRTAALVALAPLLPQGLLGEALRAAPAIASEPKRMELLVALAPRLTAAQRTSVLGEALRAARKIGYETTRGRALLVLAPQLPAGLLGEALSAARALHDEIWRAQVLTALAPRLSAAQRTCALEQALSAARTILDKDARAQALVALAPLRPESLGEALSAAQGIDEDLSRAQALAALAPLLPAELLGQAFSFVATLDHEYARVHALVALAPQLPKGLLGEALRVAETIDEGTLRAQALAALAPLLPAELLGEALRAARTIVKETWRAAALVELTPLLPEAERAPALGEALSAARTIDDAAERAEALVALAPLLPAEQRAGVFGEALSAAATIDVWYACVQVLVALAPLLPTGMLGAALRAAAAIGDEAMRAKVLVAVARRLSAQARARVFGEALQAVQANDHEIWRVYLLAAVAPLLTQEQERASVLGEALDVARRIGSETRRTAALGVLAPLLPEEEDARALDAASSAVQTSADEDGEDSCAELPATSAPLLPKQASVSAANAALSAAGRTHAPAARGKALAALAPQLPEELLGKALSVAETIDDTLWRALALAALAPRLPAEEREGVVVDVLEAADTIGDETARARALTTLVPELPEELLGEASSAVETLSDSVLRVQAWAALAPRLTGQEREDLVYEALNAAAAIDEQRARGRALAAVAPLLPQEEREDALEEALSAAETITSGEGCARVLVTLAPLLPEWLLDDALRVARGIEGEVWRVQALEALAPHLPEQSLGEALSVTRTIESGSSRVRALVALALRLADEERARVLDEALSATRTIGNQAIRLRELVALAALLPEEQRADVLGEALRAAEKIDDGTVRGGGLATLAPLLSTLPAHSRRRLTLRLLRVVARGSRTTLSKCWRELDQLIALEGAAACSAAATSIIDMTRWSASG
jgi:hypothetical protein